MIKNIIFDIGAVLVKVNFDEFLINKGISKEISDRIYKASIYSPKWDEFDRNVLSIDEVMDSFAENDPEVEKELRSGYEDFTGFVSMFPYTFPWIESLKARGMKVFCLSNFPEKIWNECASELRFFDILDGGIISYREKLIKPDPAVYRLLLDRYSLKADECIFIDDREVNVNAARALGIHGTVFKDKDSADVEIEKIIKMNG